MIRTYWVVLLAFLLASIAMPVYAQTPTPTLETYHIWLRSALTAAQRGDELELREVAKQLVATQEVSLPDGKQIPIDNQWLADALDTFEPDMPAIAQRLGAILDTLAQPESNAPPNAQEELDTILNNPPFSQEETQNGLISQFLDWLLRMLDRMFQPAESVSKSTGSIAGWIMTILGGIIIFGLVIYLLLSMKFSFTRDARLKLAQHEEERLTSVAAMQQATSLARDGNYRSAMRYLYLSSLKLLDERNIIRYDPALTNREYLARLDHQEVHNHLQPIVETFDRVWYGTDVLDATSFSTYEQHIEALRKIPAS